MTKTNGRSFKYSLLAILLLCSLFLGSCAPMIQVCIEEEELPLAGTIVLTPRSGSLTYGNAVATIDASNITQGYIMCKYSGPIDKVKVQISKSGEHSTYTYSLNSNGSYEVFPLTGGDGYYAINIYEHVNGNQYILSYGTTLYMSLQNSMSPFLYPSQYVNFSSGSAAVKKGEELTAGMTSDLEKVKAIYNYVVNNISYDTSKATRAQSGQMTGYIPEVDNVMSSGKGICFDYAVLMTAMLRSQGIPAQLRVGYVTGGAYHSWVAVYTGESGWIDDTVYCSGSDWTLFDPTFASSGQQSAEIKQFIGNGNNYITIYTY